MNKKYNIIDNDDTRNTGNKEETVDTSKSNFRSKQTFVGMNYMGFKTGRNRRQFLLVSGVCTCSDNFVLNDNSNNDGTNNWKAKELCSTTTGTNNNMNDRSNLYDDLRDAYDKMSKIQSTHLDYLK